ncbi:MAG: flagellar hook-associated protein FlgK [Clostridia bacterium]|nr:flagellar hook-associated protein FlgK [Clostridia bacterium]
MAVNFASYEIARSGLFVNERGLYVTGHNIANVNTPGYVRQQAMIASARYQKDPQFEFGLGADIQKIRQIRHTFLDNVYRMESQTLGYWETRQKTVSDIQAIIGEPLNEGMQNVMNQFWDSWQELSKNPESLTARALVRQRGEALVQYVNHTGNQLDKLQHDLDSEIKVRVDEINTLTSKIAKLNVGILAVENSGDSANDLRDERNLHIDRLSRLVDCDVNEMQDGQVDITVGGYFLVNKGTNELLKTVENEPGSLFMAPALQKSGTLLPVKNGILKGLLEARGEVLGSLDSFENGSPNDKIDLVFAFNTNDTAANRNNLASNIDSIVKKYTDKGIGVRLGFVTFDHTGMTASTTFAPVSLNTNGIAVPNVSNFIAGINAIAFSGTMAAGSGIDALRDAVSASNTADSISGWKNTAKQIVLMTDSGMTTSGLSNLGTEFKENYVKTLVVSNSANKTALRSFAEITGDQFIASDALSSSQIMDNVSESVRNSTYGNVIHSKNIIPDLKNKLNLLVNALAREVNRLHRNGITLDGLEGKDFFTPVNSAYPLQMGNIRVNPLLNDLNNIVSSSDGSIGDNTVAVKLADLRHTPMLGGLREVQNMDDFYRSIVGSVGNAGAEAQRTAEGQINLVNSADNFRQTIMNVSMDEEMTNMMKYQYAYGASAKVLNAIDEMIESVISRLGVVGR